MTGKEPAGSKAKPDPLVINTQPAKDSWMVEETAARISMRLTNTYRLIKEGKIKVIRIGRIISVPQREIDAFLEREARGLLFLVAWAFRLPRFGAISIGQC